MDWITAALAFATTMLFFALVVSSLVEMIHRFVGLRQRGLQLMLENFYDQVVSGYVKRADPDSTLTAEEFAEAIMANRAVESVDHAGGATRSDVNLSGRMIRWLSARTMTNVPVELFAQKLAAKVSFAEENLTTVVQDISQKYVAFGEEASEYFRRRARLFSVIVAFPVAFLFYVQPYDLAQAFLRDPTLARRIADANVDLLKKLEPPPVNSQASASSATATGDSGANTAPSASGEASGDAEVKRLRAELAALREGFRQWDQMSIPVGWPDLRGVPTCRELPANERVGILWSTNCSYAWPLAGDVLIPSPAQLFWLCIGALLVGLGAPFWAQAIGALTVSRGAVEKIGAIVEADDTRAARAAAPAAAGTAAAVAARSTPVRSFAVARTAEQTVRGPR